MTSDENMAIVRRFVAEVQDQGRIDGASSCSNSAQPLGEPPFGNVGESISFLVHEFGFGAGFNAAHNPMGFTGASTVCNPS